MIILSNTDIACVSNSHDVSEGLVRRIRNTAWLKELGTHVSCQALRADFLVDGPGIFLRTKHALDSDSFQPFARRVFAIVAPFCVSA